MYCELGLFKVPENQPHWVESIRYYPEPPIQVKGALNPWQLERTRLVYQAEEKAWIQIQKEMATYKALRLEAEAWIVRFNQKVAELEGLTGKKSGLFSVDNIASFVAASSGNPYIMAALAVKMVVDMILGNKKKKKIQKLIEELQQLQGWILANHTKMEAIQGAVSRLVHTGEALRAEQKAVATVAVQNSEIAYIFRQAADKQKGAAYRALNEEVAKLYPTRRGGNDAL